MVSPEDADSGDEEAEEAKTRPSLTGMIYQRTWNIWLLLIFARIS
jgi:hypothetical protein